MPPTKFYPFQTFADTASFSGAFRDNILQFLRQCAEPQYADFDSDGVSIWSTFLVYQSKGLVFPLYTIEESVKVLPTTHLCDYCRFAGWGNRFVSKRNYHFIIPGDDDWNRPLADGAFDLQSHLLHGLIHCNGFGHLICINGIAGGSTYISGAEIMDFWDRICSSLHSRKITVEDLSKKKNMDLRLLYGVAYGTSWFGRWGYRFSNGSFGVRVHNYESAMGALSSIHLDQVIKDFIASANKGKKIKQIIHHYRELSDTSLITLRDLLSFMLSLKAPSMLTAFKSSVSKKVCKGKPRKFSNLAANLGSRWPVRRLEDVAQVIVQVLKERRAENCFRSCGMTRQEVRDAARLHIGDTGLIDHVLKAMNNVIIGDFVVRREVNRSTKVLEYSIQELGHSREYINTERNVSNDISYLYHIILLEYPCPDKVRLDAQILLRSKHFVKEWPFRDENDDLLRFIFRLSLSLQIEMLSVFPPWDYIAIPLYSTIGDLKGAVQKAMQETYCGMENIWVVEIVGMEEKHENEVVIGISDLREEIVVRAVGFDLGNGVIWEGGKDDEWTVKCKCGAQDDDGERMVACDICGIWQHTLCSGIEDSESVPRLFVCEHCCSSLAPPRNWGECELTRSMLPYWNWNIDSEFGSVE